MITKISVLGINILWNARFKLCVSQFITVIIAREFQNLHVCMLGKIVTTIRL